MGGLTVLILFFFSAKSADELFGVSFVLKGAGFRLLGMLVQQCLLKGGGEERGYCVSFFFLF